MNLKPSYPGCRRLFLLAFLLCGVRAAQAQPIPPPVTVDKEFSADMTITDRKGAVIHQKIYSSNGKVRMEQSGGITLIVRPDQNQVYTLMVEEQLMMVTPYDPKKMADKIALFTNAQGDFVKIGPAVIDGVPCMEYKFTPANKTKVYDMWVDTVRKIPVKSAAEDGSFSMEGIAAPDSLDKVAGTGFF
jgi:hypothetical protein